MMRFVLSISVAASLLGCRQAEGPADLRLPGADPERGRALIERVGCAACHVIPGVSGPDGRLGPSLAQIGSRGYLAGSVPNQPGLLVQFVRDAPSLVPTTAMPDLPLDDHEARDVAAYLYTLR